MAKTNPMLRYIGLLTRSGSAPAASDADLLERFVDHQEEAAFAALLERYRGLVMGVCRRVLRDVHDAEDAFQATFVVLARKAGSIRGEQTLGGWLHRVAFHIALRAKAGSQRRQAVEKQVEIMRPSATEPERNRGELRDVLDEELDRLPAKYRQPLVLHYLEGKTKDETAQALGWTEGTVSGRLGRARDMLRDRLARRGMALSAGTLALALAQEAAYAAVPVRLLEATVRGALLAAAGKAAVAGVFSARVLGLADAATKALETFRLKLLVCGLLMLGIAGGGWGLWHSRTSSVVATVPKSPVAQPKLEVKRAGFFQGVALAPDLRRMVSVASDGTVEIWKQHPTIACKYTICSKLKQPTAQGTSLERLPDGTTRAQAYGGAAAARATCLQLSPDGGTLAVGYQDGSIRLWDPVSSEAIVRLSGGHVGPVNGLVFGPDGYTLASASLPPEQARPSDILGGDLKVWDLRTRRERRSILLHNSVLSLAFTADGKELVAINRQFLTLQRWDVSTGREKPVPMPGHYWCGALSPEGKFVVLLRKDATVHLWDLTANRVRYLFRIDPRQRVWLAVSPEARTIFCADDMTHLALVWDVAKGKIKDSFQVHKVRCTGAAFSRDGSQVAVAGLEGKPRPGWNTVGVTIIVHQIRDTN